MNKEETLQRIKDEVAKEYGYNNWNEAKMEPCTPEALASLMHCMETITNRYAIAMCEEQKKECLKYVEADYISDINGTYVSIDENTILNSPNVAE